MKTSKRKEILKIERVARKKYEEVLPGSDFDIACLDVRRTNRKRDQTGGENCMVEGRAGERSFCKRGTPSACGQPADLKKGGTVRREWEKPNCRAANGVGVDGEMITGRSGVEGRHIMDKPRTLNLSSYRKKLFTGKRSKGKKGEKNSGRVRRNEKRINGVHGKEKC